MNQQQKKNTIICFTASYPFGSRETYFENELDYLSKAFDQVYILPTYNPTKSDKQRTVPPNTIILPIAVPQGISRIVRGIFNLSPISPFLIDLVKYKVYKKRSHLIKWIKSFISFRIRYQQLHNLLDKVDTNTLLYSYWGGPTVFVTNLCKHYKKVIRMHGGDFYLNRNNGYLPLRKKIYQSADLLLPISNDIADKLYKDYQITPEKIFVNYLGTNLPQTINKPSSDGIIRVVSCSNLYPLKRVHLIAATICNWKHHAKIEWHHFGDGPEMNNIKMLTNNCSNKNVSFFFHGWVSTQTIYSFYSNHYITWLINVSKFEGIPVSIMEAFSFGIPAIATDAGATSEIVNETNGMLIGLEITEDILEKCILSCHAETYQSKRNNAQITWKKKFNAETNYTQLVDKLKSLSVR
ncbi:MAG: glycosyltransferase [Chitinophagaceae bacterium]|nr:glycosyltransferase [Chitinophagaceae bacterium]